MITKNDDEVKLNSGNDFRIYYNNAWITLGNIVSGKLTKQGSEKEIKYNNGYKFKKRSGVEGTCNVVLAQISKEILDTIDQILSLGRSIYIYNGLDNSKHQEFFIKKANLIEKLEINMAGDEHQTLSLDFSIVPQTSNVSVTPSSELPSDAKSHGTSSLQTGYNPLWIVLETAA